MCARPFSRRAALRSQIDGVGSDWNCTEQLFVGYEADAVLTISGGAHVTSGTGQIGFASTGNGRVRINGAGSQWNNTESLYVGVVGTGDLIVSNGGVVDVDDLLSIGPRGMVQGNSTIVSEIRNGGTVAPGLPTGIVPTDSLGTLSVNSDYEQTPAGTLEIQLDSPTVFDKLNITGEAALAGTLDVSYSNNGFSPAAGAIFEILHADGGVFDGFTSMSLPALDPGLTWNVIYSNFAVLLNVLSIPPGDYNQNGFVDAADYVVWRDTLGQMGAGLAADGNNNGANRCRRLRPVARQLRQTGNWLGCHCWLDFGELSRAAQQCSARARASIDCAVGVRPSIACPHRPNPWKCSHHAPSATADLRRDDLLTRSVRTTLIVGITLPLTSCRWLGRRSHDCGRRSSAKPAPAWQIPAGSSRSPAG